MTDRLAALVAALLVALLALTWVTFDPQGISSGSAAASPEEQILAARSSLLTEPAHDKVPLPSRTPAPASTAPAATAPPAPVIDGIASNYPGTAGFLGQPVVALPGAMGGRYSGGVQGYATVCADRCVRVAVVDWCQCYWGTSDQRVVDISHAAWPLITDKPLSAGLVQVRVILDDPRLAAAWNGS